ncbi:hypothetical protein LCGC14_3124110, partial [marine sediment metagenome]
MTDERDKVVLQALDILDRDDAAL